MISTVYTTHMWVFIDICVYHHIHPPRQMALLDHRWLDLAELQQTNDLQNQKQTNDCVMNKSAEFSLF